MERRMRRGVENYLNLKLETKIALYNRMDLMKYDAGDAR